MATVTKADRENQYTLESLGDALEREYSCRHTARIAHLYLSRTPHLSNSDYQSHLPVLFNRVFGEFTDNRDDGWLGRTSSSSSKAPRSLQAALSSNLEDTFNVVKWGKDLVAAFRVFHLLTPTEQGNLYHFVFHRPHSHCVYYFPTDRLPPSFRSLFRQWINMLSPQSGVVVDPSLLTGNKPSLLNVLSLTGPQDVLFQRHDSLALNLKEFYIFRFIEWFVTERDDKASGLPNTKASTKFKSSGDAGASAPSSSASTKVVKTSTMSKATSKLTHRAGASGSGSATSGASSKLSVNNTSQPTLNPSTIKQLRLPVASIIVGNPAIELFLQHCRDFLPHDGIPSVEPPTNSSSNNGPGGHAHPQMGAVPAQVYTLVNEEHFVRDQWLLLHGIIEFWLKKHLRPMPTPPPPTAANQIGPGGAQNPSTGGFIQTPFGPPGGAPLQGGPGNNVSILNFPLPNLRTMQGLLVLVLHLQSDPMLVVPTSQAAQVDKFGKDPRVLVQMGSSAMLQMLRQPLFSYFEANLTNVSTSYGSEFVAMCDLWLTYLKPWNAEYRMKVNPFQSAAPKSSVVSTTFARVSGHGGAAKSSAPQQVTKRPFSQDWIWFVVQNYLVYSWILKLVARKAAEANAQELLGMINRVFEPNGAFNDGIIAVILSCEVIVQDTMSGQNRPLNTVIGDRWMATPSGRPTVAGQPVASSNPAANVNHELVRQIMGTLDQRRDLVVQILKNQFNDLSWDISKMKLPLLGEISGHVEQLLNQIHLFLDTHESKTRSQNKSNTSLGWIPGMLSSSPINRKKQADYSTMFKGSVDRMHAIFNVQSYQSNTVARAPSFSKRDEEVIKSPETETVVAEPTWLRRRGSVLYTRLTDKGREQLESGTRIHHALDSEFVGDPLLSPPPVCSYEIFSLVKVLHSVSITLNRVLGLGVEYTPNSNGGDPHKPYKRAFRVNLRFLADVRNLFWGLFLFDILDIVLFRTGLTFWSFPLLGVLYAGLFFEGTAFWVTSLSVVSFFVGLFRLTH